MAEIKLVTVAGADALAELERRRAVFHKTGQYPVLLGCPDDWERIREVMSFGFDPAEILAESKAIDALAWFAENGAPDEEDAEVDFDDDLDEADDMGIVTHRDVLTNQPFDKVLIGLFDVAEPWEVFAHLAWGSWNACPAAAEHCALHRYWAAEYGAEVASLTGDVAQCRVARPPETDGAASRLARQQCAYCSDIVDQGTGTVEALAAGLRGGRTWYFWWD